MDISTLLAGLLNAELELGFGKPILWREIIGNVFGLASAFLGLRRKVWAWPIGIVGNVLLFTVFTGVIFSNPQDLTLWGQSGRQVFFVAVSLYGWYGWWRYRNSHDGDEGVDPRWATGRERLAMVVAWAALWFVLTIVLTQLGSWGPLLDAYILSGSIMATYGMARGYVEFWVIWLLVDAVGIPTLLMAQFYPSAIMYAVYGGLCLVGFVNWWRLGNRRRATLAAASDEPAPLGEDVPVKPLG